MPTPIVGDGTNLVLDVWVVPPDTFYLLVHVGDAGCFLTIVLARAIIVAVAHDTVVVVSCPAMANDVHFLVGPGEGRRRAIPGVDDHFERIRGAIQSDHHASSTLAVTSVRSRQ